jgi:hypothetical protein
MIETLHKRHSMFRLAAKRFRQALAATLALALGIGVNAAIFNLEGLRYPADINPDPFINPDPLDLFPQTDFRSQTAEAATSNNAERSLENSPLAEISEKSLFCVQADAPRNDPAFELKSYALLLGDCLITPNLYRERTGVSPRIALEVR